MKSVVWAIVIILCLGELFASTTHVLAAGAQDAECSDRAVSIANDKARYTLAQAAILTGCAQDAMGSWFWPNSEVDPRLPAPVLTSEEDRATQDLGAALTFQINNFLTALAAIPDQFNPAASARANLLASLSELTEGGTSYGLGAAPGINPGGPGIQTVASYYTNLLISYANDPNRLEFARYATWWAQRRYATIPFSVQDMVPMARAGYIRVMGFDRAPWPWELQRTYTIAEYRKWAYANGYRSAQSSAVVEQPSSAVTTEVPGSSAEGPVDLKALLPSLADVPPGFTVVADRARTLNEVAQNYRDPAATVKRFEAWGWSGNVARTFALADGAASIADGTYSLYVSLHKFGDSASALAALDYSFRDQLASTGDSEVTAPGLGHSVREMRGTGSDGNEVTLYLHQGAVLMRVTAISSGGDPTNEAVSLAKSLLAK